MASIFAKSGALATKVPTNSVVGMAEHLYNVVSKGTHEGNGFSFENMTGGTFDRQTFSNESINAETQLRSAFNTATGDQNGWAGLSDGQRDVARVVMMLRTGKSAQAYQQRFFSNESMQASRPSERGMTVFGTPVGHNGAFDYQTEARDGWTTPGDVAIARGANSNEVFDGRPIDNMVATSVGFHILASKQSEAAEAIYPVYAMPPDATGFTVEVERPLVFNQLWHDATGNTVNFDKNRQLLLNARMDASILAQTATTMTPWFDSGNSANTQWFTDPTVITPWTVSVSGTPFLTSALKPGMKVTSMLGLTSNPAVAMFGKENTTDTMDNRVSLQNIYVQVTPATGASSVIQFPTLNMPYASFTPAWEGQQKRMVLNFETDDLVISGSTLDWNSQAGGTAVGTAATALSGLAAPAYANMRVRLAIDVNGKANLESSELSVSNASLTISSVVSVAGTGPLAVVTPVVDPTVLSAIAALFTSFTMVGYDVEAYRANFNRRFYGQLVTCERLKDLHIVNLGAPITAQVPIVDIAAHTVDITAPANAVMIRNTNQAWTQMFTFEQQLSLAQSAYAGGDASAPAIRAIGRYILRRPWYGYDTFEVDQELNTLKTAERNVDLAAGICNKMRMMINEGYYQTNYQAAMDNMGSKVGERPEIVAVCNPVLANYLMVEGDTRTLGEGWTLRVIPEQDTRFTIPNGDDLTYPIYFFFRVKGVDGPHPLNTGNMIYKPDLISNLPITRDNATTVEFTVQPMTLHVNHSPVMFRLDVMGLNAAATERVAIPMTIT